MVLLHEAVQIVHEPVPGIFSVLEMDPNVDGLDGAYLLAHAAEDAPELVDFVNDGVAIPLVVLSTHQTDAVGWADGGAKTAGYTLRPAVGMHLHPMSPPPSGGKFRSFLRVLEGDLIGIHKMLEGQGHSLKGGT